MVKVLVVEDDLHIQHLIKFNLELEGLSVLQAFSSEEALDKIYEQPFDLVLLNHGLTYKDGNSLYDEIRRDFLLPILFLTRKKPYDNQVNGVQLKDDYYIVEPFNPLELIQRVKGLLQRYHIVFSETLTIGQLKICKKDQMVFVKNHLILLPHKEFQILFKLASYPGKTFTRMQLIKQIWGTDYQGDERTIDVHIKRLRKRFKQWSDEFVIVTVRGMGYRLEAKRYE
ncbi:winged helix-turn-helix domain-containing protein [Thermoflavimicrobium daqui]|uniref:Heme response regulator HssR n=1 Tax=Thermoflavimicrobium daqui TaxID=2137476 RepID=A0A364K3F9_9BACL|nr:response regulator transcription factor [Thermoflavimicrobium daqui]RAL23344.1 DNA-binding response regulator [Thermoflavimicrobium daqui]